MIQGCVTSVLIYKIAVNNDQKKKVNKDCIVYVRYVSNDILASFKAKQPCCPKGKRQWTPFSNDILASLYNVKFILNFVC